MFMTLMNLNNICIIITRWYFNIFEPGSTLLKMRNFVVLNVLLYFTATHCFESLSVLFFVHAPPNTFEWMSVFGHASINFCFLLKYINLWDRVTANRKYFIGGEESNIRTPYISWSNFVRNILHEEI